jgi:CheY-like chemotaxis protein
LLDAVLAVMGLEAAKPSRDSEEAGKLSLVTRHSLRENQHRLHILLAEDNVVNQKLAARVLEKRGHTVVVVENGKEALAALERHGFDLVLMDVQMPEMDGLEATRVIREQEKETGGHVPIIAMTAYAMKGDRERCLEAGMDAYVSKPIQAGELFQAIERLIPSVTHEITKAGMTNRVIQARVFRLTEVESAVEFSRKENL